MEDIPRARHALGRQTTFSRILFLISIIPVCEASIHTRLWPDAPP